MPVQHLKFSELYKNCKQRAEHTLATLWCGETGNESQKDYAKQIRELIARIFAPETAIPLVECLNRYKAVYSVTEKEATDIVDGLWTKNFPPYEHQYKCWDTVLRQRSEDDKFKSFVVTTGTGSGKTECFMLPLVADLKRLPINETTQAIFLYPLNALMEDQKERLEELLDGTELRYCVYNGDLPEKTPKPDDTSDFAESERRKIDMIRGIVRDSNGQVIEHKFKHCIATRDELRKHPAQILLTNPTMLEYILLRTKDSNLLSPKSLRWMVIDETHTYSGAGAAELAMLLRRVLLAFDMTAEDIRFATSSATLGNAKNEEERTKLREELRKFIADLTGLKPAQINVIGGERRGVETIPDNKDKSVWTKLITSDTGYISLNELISGKGSVAEKLELLDEMCDRLPDDTQIKVKVHFFFRVPNNGLYVRLDQLVDGSFKIYTEKTTDKEAQEAPLIELSRCKHCGEYLAVAQIQKGGTYGPIIMDESDMFDIEQDDEHRSDKFIFALTNKKLQCGDNNAAFMISGDKFLESPGSMNEDGGWKVIANTQNQCPHCSTKLTKTVGEEGDADSYQEEDGKKLQKFRFSTDLISRIIAPELLDQLAEADNQDGVLHQGQQYISFVDSRQGAARGSLGQNLEQERMWAYSKIFHELSKRAIQSENIEKQIAEKEEALRGLDARRDRAIINTIYDEIDALEQLKSGSLTWKEITELLSSDPISDMFARQFAKRTANSAELDNDGNPLPIVKRRYIQSIMVEFLGKRPLHSASPETMGLFGTSYPLMKDVMQNELPKAVKEFNKLINHEALRINNEDWYNLLQVFLDYQVRSNESIFLRLREDDPLDIKSCVRFATQRQRRRTVKKPAVATAVPSRVVRYIAQLLVDDGMYVTQKEALRNERESIQGVIDALWQDLTETYKILEHGTQYDKERGSHVKDRDMDEGDDPTPWRLNVANLSFRLFDKVALVDTNTNGTELSAKRLRPVNVWFKNYSPYLKNRTHVLKINKDLTEGWSPFNGTENSEELRHWASLNRKLIWDNGLWGEDGVFAERLNLIYGMPNTFIQAEHTAQVDKMISRQVQRDFKKHKLNILACSTTMEMGVDLGDLELVMMSSVPPQPSNYKQRAGRSGRNNFVRSVAVTLCGSDAVGLRTQLSPMDNIISRKMASPETDLSSAQVIQRHVNAFLVREFGVFGMSDHAGSINQKVADYYTSFEYGREGNHVHYYKAENEYASPVDGLGNPDNTPYERFNDCCSQALSTDLRTKLHSLLRGTIYDGRMEYVVRKAREANERCYAELEWKIEDISMTYRRTDISKKYRNLLNIKFIELIDEQLLGFWATNRFSPNANMPVNVVSFDVNSEIEDYYKASTTSNPSYSLRDALQQYAPGNSIVIDGRVNIVRGLRYTGFFKRNVTFKTLYHNSQQTVIDAKNDISQCQPWRVNNEVGLEMIQPTEFLPDINESENRILANNIFTRVNAQLIGASDWKEIVTEPHLFSLRSSRESGSAKILYYNDGIGYGYCHCTRCGRTVIENKAADAAHKLEALPSEFNTIPSSDDNRPDFHYEVSGREEKRRCAGSNNPDSIKRNIILGDLIQTDYTEVRIRMKGKSKWINIRTEANEGLLVTLGLAFRRSLAEILGKDTSAIDFTITPNAHICIFDTNPGGAGYSNQLAEMEMMKEVINHSYEMLQAAETTKSKDMLLDKFSLHYIDKLDIPGAIKWIEEENENAANIPNEVRAVLGASAMESSLTRIERAAAVSEGEIILFVDNDFDKWNYGDSDCGWRGHLLNHFQSKGDRTKFIIIENAGDSMNEPVKEMAREIQSWASYIGKMSNPLVGNNIYPLAYIDGKLFLTNNSDFSTLNECWGNGTVFVADYHLDTSNVENIDLRYKSTSAIIKLEGETDKEISSLNLGKVIEAHSQSIINEFISHCNRSDEPIKIKYQDEHLKSVLAIILALQTIDYFAVKFDKSFSLEFLVEKYQDIQRRPSLASNLANNSIRDMYLSGLARTWIENCSVSGTMMPLQSEDRNTLTHWRELSFECAGKKLSIYPDGGFLNGWGVSRRNNHFINPDECDASTEVLLTRIQDIKIDVTIENV